MFFEIIYNFYTNWLGFELEKDSQTNMLYASFYKSFIFAFQQQQMQGNLLTTGTQTSKCTDCRTANCLQHRQTQNASRSIFGPCDKNIILFAYNKFQNENSPQQIMVLQQTKKKVKYENEEEAINSMLSKICFEPQAEEKFFLKKVDPFERKQIAQEIKQMLSLSNQLSLQDRLERRREIFESSKARKKFDYATQEVIAKRTIKVVKLDSLMQGGSVRGIVELGGKSVQYEDLNMEENSQQYYTLIKKTVRSDEIYPEIQLQRDQMMGEISYQPDEAEKQYDLYGDEYDSNDSDNPNYDYPDEEESEKSSEGIIEREYDEEDNNDHEYEEDQEELYNKYLRRLKKKEKEMQIEPEYEDYD